jgi:hypothetical protein
VTTFSGFFSNSPSFFSQKFSANIVRLFSESLSRQIKYFVVEGDVVFPPERILEIKQRNVSGEATSFLSELLDLDSLIGKSEAKHFKDALWFLGSLTQFTDDLRDYDKDKLTKNANLMISLEKFYGDKSKEVFLKWYLKEEGRMVSFLKKSNVSVDEDLIMAVPFHPYFLKPEEDKL